MLLYIAALVAAFTMGLSVATNKFYPIIQKQDEMLLKTQRLLDQEQKYNAIARRIIFYESSGRHNVWGDHGSKYPVYGIAQFQERTFKWLAKLAHEPNLEWKNKQHQIWLLGWALRHGYGHLWGKNFTKAITDVMCGGHYAPRSNVHEPCHDSR